MIFDNDEVNQFDIVVPPTVPYTVDGSYVALRPNPFFLFLALAVEHC